MNKFFVTKVQKVYDWRVWLDFCRSEVSRHADTITYRSDEIIGLNTEEKQESYILHSIVDRKWHLGQFFGWYEVVYKGLEKFDRFLTHRFVVVELKVILVGKIDIESDLVGNVCI